MEKFLFMMSAKRIGICYLNKITILDRSFILWIVVSGKERSSH
jgi:hypothetical protein